MEELHNEELNDLYCSPNIVQVIKASGSNRFHVLFTCKIITISCFVYM